MFHELDFGGAKRVVIEFAKRLKKDNIVDLYYVDEDKDIDIDNYFSNTYFYKFNSKIWKGNNWKVKLYKDTIELIKLCKLHRKISEDIKRKQYDYIFVHPSKYTQSPFLLRFLQNKSIYFCQEPLRMVYDLNLLGISHIKFPKNIYEFINRKIRKWIDAENFKSASTILANSNYSKEFIEKSYGKKAEVCYLGIDTNFFRPLNLNKSIDVLFIGNKDKTYDLLHDSLRLFEVKPNLHVIFRGNKNENISDKELVGIYNKSKILVALNHCEPFGLIPLEAMSCGTPVIAINEGGYKESVIDNKTGFLIPRETKELYDKINKIINNEKMRQEMGKNARKNVLQNWTWDKSVDRFLKIVQYAK